MATALITANKTWQLVNSALKGANPCAVAGFKALKEWLAQQKGNPDLQFVPYTGETTLGASGEDTGIDAACRVYGFYGKKPAAKTEDVYLYLFDDATNDAGGATDGRANLVFWTTSHEAFAVYPSGLPMTDGLVVKAYTDFDGTTDSTDTDCPNGFVLIGPA